MSPPQVADPLLGQNVGGYIVEEPLGEGSMGLVYRARHPLLNRHFAIKVLRPEIAAEAASLAQFAREAQTLSGLKHPSIIDIVGFGPMSDGRQYMVMEYLLGKTLEQELTDEGRLSPERALLICDEILDGLFAAHSVEVIHRDLKPSNVFLETVSGGREVVKLLDFGLAKQQPVTMLGGVVVTSSAAASSIAGTPEYIAPEQAYGNPASPQSDLYSFGVILFRMLTGSLPFKVDAESPDDQQIYELMMKHVHEAPPTIQEAAPDAHFPDGLAELVAQLLMKKPGERPASAEDARNGLRKVYHALQQAAALAAAQPALAVLAKKRSGARRLGVLLALALVLVLGGVGWWSLGSAPPPPEPLPLLAAAIVIPPAQAAELPVEPVVALPPVDELEQLSPIVKPRKHAAVAPGCVPDPEWKKRARADLNELVTLAAKLDPGLSLWASEQEGSLSGAIEGASTERECGVVWRQLQTFKDKVARK